MKFVYIFAKIVLTLLLVSPILGVFDFMPAPTPEMYNSPKAYEFISLLMETKYITIIQAIVFALSAFFLWTKREALASLLLLPITVNIVAFHAFLDGGLLTAGALMGNVLAILNIFFIWINRDKISPLFIPRARVK